MRLRGKKRYLVPAAALSVVLAGAGAAYAYFTSVGAGAGQSQVGTSANLVIKDLTSPALYDSTIAPLPGSLPSYGPEAYAFNEIGNEVNLASSSQPLNNVVVTMESWACQSGNWYSDNCVTTPGATFPVPVTLTLYNPGTTAGTVGSVIATDTQTFNIPYRPSADNINCNFANADSGNGPPSGEWYDAATGQCYNGLADNITFDFTSQDLVLPSKVVYGISFNTDHYGPAPLGGTNSPTDSLNVAFTTASQNISAGSDAIPGSIFVNSATASNTQLFCNTITPDAFVAAENDCAQVSGTPPTYDIPAVQLNATEPVGLDLFPGGPAQQINYTVTNPGGGPEHLGAVTISIASITDQHPTSGDSTCEASWFSITQPPAFDGTIQSHQTLTFRPSGATIQLTDSGGNQDACEGATVNLAFTSD